MKYITSSRGFDVVPNKAEIPEGGYVYKLDSHRDASDVLLNLMDIQATERQFVQFGKDLSKANSPKG